jgi:acetyltransferase-like isoleucine patch superfamily enzyme
MRKLINKIISKIKGEPYEMDKNIPTGYLVGLVFQKINQLQRGFWTRLHFRKHHKGKRVFIGAHVKIKAKKLISCGRGVTIGDYSYIDALSNKGITIGNNVSLGRNTIIECTGVIRELGEELVIEDGVGIAANSFIAVRGGVRIGKNTIIGPGFHLHSENHVFTDLDKPIRLQGATRKGVTIGEDCWIGSNVTILDGVHIGNKCVIAAGAVVTKDAQDYSIIGGVPAKLIRLRKEN